MTIKTVKSSGGDYTTLQAAIDACPSDITAAGTNQTWEIECYSTVTNSEDITVSGKTTDSDHFIRIYAAPGNRHNGVSGGFQITGSYYAAALSCSVSDLKIEGIRFVVGVNPGGIIYVTGAGTRRVIVDGCIFPTGFTYAGVKIDSCTGGTIVVANCVGIESGIAYNQSGSGYTTRCYNNSVYISVNGNGFDQNSVATMICVNNLVSRAAGSGFAYQGSYTSSSYNASADNSAPGTNALTSWTHKYTDAANGNLALTEEVAGTNLSGDGTYPFSTDIKGQTRSGWSRGAFEFSPAGSGGGHPLAGKFGTLLKGKFE